MSDFRWFALRSGRVFTREREEKGQEAKAGQGPSLLFLHALWHQSSSSLSLCFHASLSVYPPVYLRVYLVRYITLSICFYLSSYLPCCIHLSTYLGLSI